MCVHFVDPTGPNVFLPLCHEMLGVEPAQQRSPVLGMGKRLCFCRELRQDRSQLWVVTEAGDTKPYLPGRLTDQADKPSQSQVLIQGHTTPRGAQNSSSMPRSQQGKRGGGTGAHSLLGVPQQCWPSSSPWAPCPGRSSPRASWTRGCSGHLSEGAQHLEERGVSALPLSIPRSRLSSRQAVKDPSQLSRQRRIMKTVP